MSILTPLILKSNKVEQNLRFCNDGQMHNLNVLTDLLIVLGEVEAHDGVLSLRHVPDLLHGASHVSASVEAVTRVNT